ncbi:TrmB family transcriptional regulator [bacterium]|nr:TrmB family transcriptional regulator [bacterium]
MTIEDFLKILGLSDNEVRLYLALVQIGEGTVDELVRISQVRRPSAYSSLRRLLAKGLVAEVTEKPLRYKIIPPELSIEGLYMRKLREVEMMKDNLHSFYERFWDELGKIRKEGENVESWEKDIILIRGVKSLVKIVSEFESRVSRCLRATILFPGTTEEEIEVISDEYEEVGYPEVDPSVELRVLVEKGVVSNPKFIEILKGAILKGIVRQVDSIPLEFSIYDDFAAMLELPSAGTDKNIVDFENCKMVCIQNRYFVRLLTIAFDAMWEKATPVEVE